jgi:hypothetical protein
VSEADEINEKTAGSGVTVDGVLLKDSEVTTDVINEKTGAAGVTADGVLLKDSTIALADGAVSNLSVKIGADKNNGLYGISDTQLGIAVEGSLVGGANTSGLFTDVIAEQTNTSGVTVDGVVLKDSTVKTANGAVGAVAVGNAVNNGLIFGTNTVSLVTNGTERWLLNSSGNLNPVVDNSYDIGNVSVNPATVFATTAFEKKGLASTEGYGRLALKSKSASKAFAGGGTEVIPTQVPSGARIIGCQLRNDTTLVATTGVSYSAAYSTGSTQAIASGVDYVKNTKTNTMFNTNGATDITSAATDITLTPNAGTLDTGTVVAVVYYYELTTMSSAA